MAIQTITELVELLNQVDIDATVLAAIANDSAISTASGPSAGIVTTRLGSNVKNVQKLIADIENGIIVGPVTTVASLPAGATVGSKATVTDATVTTFASIVVGGGANTVPVYSDGTNWLIG